MTTAPPADVNPLVRHERERTTALRYRSDCIAYTNDRTRLFWLGAKASTSPWSAVFWIAWRAVHIAEQLDPAFAAPVRGWLNDGCEHAHAIAILGRGESYALTVHDEEVRYVFTVDPFARNAEGARAAETDSLAPTEGSVKRTALARKRVFEVKRCASGAC